MVLIRQGAPCQRPTSANLCLIFTNEKVLRCPADTPNTLMYKRRVYLTSYVWNVTCEGFYASATETINGTPCNSTLKLSQFKADDILLWENDETLVTATNHGGQWDDTWDCPDEGISARHGKAATIGNADGPAERILLSDYYWLASGQRTPWTGGCCSPQPWGSTFPESAVGVIPLLIDGI